MLIREATQKDIPAIVKVLKASLGEDELALSEEIWNYKHINNPFGESLVLLAEEDKKIVGVRAFMRWKWQKKDKLFSALRAVDTATHPDFQGKGIFKRLTLKAVDQVKEAGDHFVFNTPNEQSRPGYLKMGWQVVGKIHVGLKPSLSFLTRSKINSQYAATIESSDDDLEELCHSWNHKMKQSGKIFTPKSLEYLKWRYQNNPLQNYEVLCKDGIYIAGYVKKRVKLREFRISECIFEESPNTKRQLSSLVKRIERKFGCHFISFAPQLLPLQGKRGNYGPILTINSLNLLDKESTFFYDIKNWKNSLGDLELY